MLDEYTVETIDRSDTERVRVVYDLDARNPITDWDMGLSFYPLNASRDYITIESGKGEHNSALSTIEEWAADEDEAAAAMLKHFRRAGIPARMVELTAQRDYVGRYVIYQDEEGDYLDGSIRTIQSYYDGSVYGILHEVRETYINAADPDDSHTHWNVTDSVFGFIGYDHTMSSINEHFPQEANA